MSHREPHSDTADHQLKQRSPTHSPLLAGHMQEKAQRNRPRRRKLYSPSYLTFLAAFGAVLCWIGAGLVLWKAHGASIDDWPTQPSVFLSILSVLAALCLRSANHHGSAVQWWAAIEDLDINDLDEDGSQGGEDGHSKSQKNDKENLQSQLRQANRLWQSAHSVWSAIPNLWRDRKYSALPIASILFTLLPASSPLLQKASYVQGFVTNSSSTFQLSIRTTLQGNETGIMDASGLTTSLTQDYANLIGYYGINGFFSSPNITGCESNDCTVLLDGLGIHATCQYSTTNDYLDVSGNHSLDVFDVTLIPGGSSNGSSYLMTLQTTWKENGTFLPDTNECFSIIGHKECTFTSAVLGYNASIGEGYAYLSDRTNYTFDSVRTQNHTDHFSYWSGIYFLLFQLYDSSATLAYSSNKSNVTLQGYSASAFLDDTTQSDCNKVWDDPTDSFLESIRYITFTTALALGDVDQSSPQNITVYAIGEIFLYQSSYKFLGLALVVSFLSFLSVVYMAGQGNSTKRNANWSPIGLINWIRPGLVQWEEYPRLLKWLSKLDPNSDNDNDNDDSS